MKNDRLTPDYRNATGRTMTEIINATPRYPGDAIRQAFLKRGDELGDVRIQKYGVDSYRVAAFTPGYETSSPGDTPKMNPDYDEWCSSPDAARREYNLRLARAHAEGWTDYDPNAAQSKTTRPARPDSMRNYALERAGLEPARPASRERQLPGHPYSDVELGVRREDIYKAMDEHLDMQTRRQVRARARQLAIERNRADSKRPDVSGRSAAHRPLFEDRP